MNNFQTHQLHSSRYVVHYYPSNFQAVEKWIALVRFRKAVNVHNLEVNRLQSLLNMDIAEGGQERSRLTSELEEVSNRFSLDDMEHALHMEVRTVHRLCTRYSMYIEYVAIVRAQFV